MYMIKERIEEWIRRGYEQDTGDALRIAMRATERQL